nr:unnamed protein product [Callosobruchus chinensis]
MVNCHAMSLFRKLLRTIFQRRFFSVTEFKYAQKQGDKDKDTKNKADKKKNPKMKTFKIYRFDPEGGNKKPKMQSYTIDINDCRPMVLDALMKIKVEQDSTLSFRKSCREGICGSCGVNIDGINRLACLHKIRPRGTTKIYPLPHMYVIKDLIVDMNKFLEQHSKIKPYPIPKQEHCAKAEGEEQFLQSIKDRERMDGLVECILCACCSTSCPEYWWHGHTKAPNEFLGPAALLNAYRWIVDTRDGATKERLNELRNYYNVYRCHQINNCTSVCPKRLEPGRAIAQLRLHLARFKKKPKPDMEGKVPADPYKACPQDECE